MVRRILMVQIDFIVPNHGLLLHILKVRNQVKTAEEEMNSDIFSTSVSHRKERRKVKSNDTLT